MLNVSGVNVAIAGYGMGAGAREKVEADRSVETGQQNRDTDKAEQRRTEGQAAAQGTVETAAPSEGVRAVEQSAQSSRTEAPDNRAVETSKPQVQTVSRIEAEAFTLAIAEKQLEQQSEEVSESSRKIDVQNADQFEAKRASDERAAELNDAKSQEQARQVQEQITEQSNQSTAQPQMNNDLGTRLT
jgi:glucose repression mediator protein